MKKFRWLFAMLLVVATPFAFADSVPTFTTPANITVFPNFGGDNDFFTFDGPGASMSGNGTAVCRWCVAGEPFDLGSTLTPSFEFLTFGSVDGTVQIGGQIYPVNDLSFASIVALRSFTFPTNGTGSFTVSVPAVLDRAIPGRALAGDKLLPFSLHVPKGQLQLTFTRVLGQNGFPTTYEFSEGAFVTVVPEPGTLGLLGTGLAGIVGAALRKRAQQNN